MQTEPMDESAEARFYYAAYALARGQLAGLSQASGYPLNAQFEGLLSDLDAMHHGDPPPALTPTIGTSSDQMLVELHEALEQMIQHGGDLVFLRVIYHRARTTRRNR